MGTTRAAEEVGASKDIVLPRKSLPDIHLVIQQVVGEHLLWVRPCLGAAT